jgi:hypothetical protein
MEVQRQIKLNDIRYQGTLLDTGMYDLKNLIPGKYVILMTNNDMHQVELYLQNNEWWYAHDERLFRYGDGKPMENI